MGVLDQNSRSGRTNPMMRTRAFPLIVIAFFLVFGLAARGYALQKHAPGSEGTPPADQVQPGQKTPAQEKPAVPPQQAQPPAQPHAGADVPKASPLAPALPKPTEPKQDDKHGAAPGAEEPHAAAHDEDHVQLPEISPIPGVTFVDTLIHLLEHELNERTFGWRPNDLLVGRFTDDINNYQLGVLEAVRFTALRLKDSLTRLGDADTYDPDLEQAVNYLMNSATKWWFPSAEDSYKAAVNHLKNFKGKLERGQRHFYYRRDNLVSLISTYKDQSGNVNRSLVMPVGWFQADDHFYYAKGAAHVYYEILKVCRVGFKNQLTTMHAIDITDTVLHELHIAEKIDPWIILNSGYGGILANHRANLNAPLSEVAHLLVVLSQL